MKKSVVLWIHVGYWCLVGLITLITFSLFKHIKTNDLGELFRHVSYARLVIFYVSYFLMYLVLKNKRNVIYVLLFFLIAFLYPLLFWEYNIALNFYSLSTVMSSSILGALFYLGIDWYQKKEQKKELERQNMQSELKLLKNQVNPHFLFNTLNNIDSLIASNPDKASSIDRKSVV